MRLPIRAALLAAGLLVLPGSARTAESDIQLWPVVTLNHGLGERWGAHLQARLRFDENVSRTQDFLVRPWFTWRARENLVVDLGYDYIHSFHAADEHRPWQAVEHGLRWRELDVKNRVRLDQRFLEEVDGVVVRFRYRLRGTHQIAGSGWYGVVSDEVFANLNDRGAGPVAGFEQNRLRFALGGGWLERLRAEAGYEWQYAERRSAPAVNRHVFFLELSVDTGGLPLFPWSPR